MRLYAADPKERPYVADLPVPQLDAAPARKVKPHLIAKSKISL